MSQENPNFLIFFHLRKCLAVCFSKQPRALLGPWLRGLGLINIIFLTIYSKKDLLGTYLVRIDYACQYQVSESTSSLTGYEKL